MCVVLLLFIIIIILLFIIIGFMTQGPGCPAIRSADQTTYALRDPSTSAF